MKKIAGVLGLVGLLLSGCMPETNSDLSDEVPQTFESLPYETGGMVCRTPVPVPDIAVVSHTVRILAGPGGRIRAVPTPAGMAFGVWTSPVRARAVRNYFRELSRQSLVRVRVRLTRVDRSAPYLSRMFTVRTRHAFLVARWSEGDRILAISGFFTKTGPHLVPVLSLEERFQGGFACRTETPGGPGGRISFGGKRATVRSGTETLTMTWEENDAKR
jgi:hypothetical protein